MFELAGMEVELKQKEKISLDLMSELFKNPTPEIKRQLDNAVIEFGKPREKVNKFKYQLLEILNNWKELERSNDEYNHLQRHNGFKTLLRPSRKRIYDQ